MQEGLLAVPGALGTFDPDPDRGVRFGAYVRPAMLRRMREHVRRSRAVPVKPRGEVRLLRRFREELRGCRLPNDAAACHARWRADRPRVYSRLVEGRSGAAVRPLFGEEPDRGAADAVGDSHEPPQVSSGS